MTETERKLIDILERTMEDVAKPAAILDHLKRKWEGKSFTKRTVDALKHSLGDESIYSNPAYGMCHLEWGGYGQSGGREGGSILVAYTEKSVKVDTAFIESSNPAYFAAAVKRNEERERAGGMTAGLSLLAEEIDRVNKAMRYVCKQVEYDGPFHVIRYQVKEMLEEFR